MYEPYIVWAGLALLLILWLPVAGIQKLVLEVSAWALRLTLLALLGVAGYLWFRPGELPPEVTDVLSGFPRVMAQLPDASSPSFAACVIGPLVAVLLPLLAVLDVCRKLAGRRLRRLRMLTAGPAPAAVLEPAPAPAVRRIERREAAAAMAAAARKPDRAVSRWQW
jgi:hypothetical protein